MRVLAVDPGAQGAVALLMPAGAEAHDMPSMSVRKGGTDRDEVEVLGLALLLKELRPDVAFFEQVGGRAGQSAAAGFAFGRAVGLAEAAVKISRIPFRHVPPGPWKLYHKLPTDNKDAARTRALELWPSLAAQLRLKKNVDRADALLIAAYGLHLLRKDGQLAVMIDLEGAFR